MSLWYGWGDEADAQVVPPHVAELLDQFLGVSGPPRPAPELADVKLPASRLAAAVLAELAAAVGEEHVWLDPETRIRHTRGKSTVDLLRLRAGDAAESPDAIVLPSTHGEVLEVLRVCATHSVAVVPFGGGTSVVGGLAPVATAFAGWIALDLGRMATLVSVDPVSRVAVLGPGLRGPQADALLAEHGLSLGHYPQSYEYASIGGYAATRSSGQFSAGYGRFDDMVVALRVATPAGTIEAGRAPRSAAGPDLRQLFLGSEGTLGVITSVAVRVHPLPEATTVDGWRVPSFVDGFALVRRLAQDGPLPTMVRLSDETETALNAAEVGGCLLLVAHEGTAATVAASRSAADEILTDAGATALASEIGAGWQRTRYQAPYLRDALLGIGALAETLETATFWSSVPGLYAAVKQALTQSLTDWGTPVVLCHVSHVYATGASLYFTVACRQADDPVAQWRTAKEAANRAILDHGGTITHHHAVGTDHAAAYAEEVGPLGLAALRAVKRELDPTGILNPGILL
jgi:alkyldihydroxyacetonephosphate synthase